jgi:hypothetical protein
MIEGAVLTCDFRRAKLAKDRPTHITPISGIE